ncbi:MAG TPA: hypothetical protein VGM30_10710, partial [Puia sp.]
KLMLSAVVVLGIVTTATAFKPKAFFPADLWYITTASGNPCVQSTNATCNPLAPPVPPTNEPDFFSGYYVDPYCTILCPSPRAANLD